MHPTGMHSCLAKDIGPRVAGGASLSPPWIANDFLLSEILYPLAAWAEAVNTVCLGFSYVQSVSHSSMSVMVLSMVFGEDYGFWWRRQRIFGKDYGFLAKITDFWRRLRIFWRRLRISLSLPMFTVHTNERGMCTCLH